MNYYGLGMPQNYAAALRWFEDGAKKGNVGSEAFIGAMYQKGFGVPQDYLTSVHWLRIASRHGSPLAQGLLGEAYANGDGVSRDHQKAYMWLNIAQTRITGDLQKSSIDEREVQAKLLTPAELDEAQAWVRQCVQSSYSNCGEPS